MKILDTANAGTRLKAFSIWGGFLWLVEAGTAVVLAGNQNGIFIVAGINILASGFAGFMTAKALKGKTGDSNSSALYGALPPVFAMGISLVILLATGQPFTGLSLPIIAMVSGLIGGLISQRGSKK
jgi:hypothetical protein